ENKVLTPIATKEGMLYHRDGNDQFWRVFILIEKTKTYDIVETEKQAEEGGRAFGKFQAMIADLNPRDVHEVIPNFLNIASRLKDFQESLQKDKADRAKLVEKEIQFIVERENKMFTILNMASKSQIPL